MAFGRRTTPPAVKKRFGEILYLPPEGWEEGPMENGGHLIIEPDGYHYIFMEFLYDNEPGRLLEQAISDLIKNHANEKSGMVVLSSGISKTELGVEQGYFAYTFNDSQGEQVREMHFIIPVDKASAYMLFVSVGAPVSTYLQVEPVFFKFINSIEID